MELEKVKIKRIIGPTPSGAAVLLGNEKKTFVVFVGFYEAAAIIRELNHEVPARPLTHELIQNVFLGFDVRVKQVIISTIIENTFCATLILERQIDGTNGKDGSSRDQVRIDARPSDCFVLALKNHVDVFVTRDVFDQVQDVSKMTDEVEGNLAAGQLGALGIGGLSAQASPGGTEDDEDDDMPEDPFLGGDFDEEIDDDFEG